MTFDTPVKYNILLSGLLSIMYNALIESKQSY